MCVISLSLSFPPTNRIANLKKNERNVVVVFGAAVQGHHWRISKYQLMLTTLSQFSFQF